MGIELELGFLLLLATLGQVVFAKFEIETPRWRRLLKWGVLYSITLGLYPLVGHWALAVPVAMASLGMGFHVVWCQRHGIDLWRATPRAEYYRLRGWPAWE